MAEKRIRRAALSGNGNDVMMRGWRSNASNTGFPERMSLSYVLVQDPEKKLRRTVFEESRRLKDSVRTHTPSTE